MKKLKFSYSCSLKLDAAVAGHYFTLRVVPHDDPAQTIRLHKFSLEPDVPFATQTDGHGNSLHVGRCMEPHDFFAYRVSGEAVVDASQGRGTGLDVAYAYSSPLTRPGETLHNLRAKASAFDAASASALDVFSRAQELCSLVHSEMKYTPQSTDVSTTAEQAAASGCGVCQDYAHVLCALLREDGIPARYVSGFMWGEGATHAWVEFYDGNTWWGLDPTNDCEAGDYYIALSRGRDHADCALERGVFRGAANQQQEVHVSVEVIEDEDNGS